MRLKIIQLHRKGMGYGSAHAQICDPLPEKELDSKNRMTIHAEFTLHNEPPVCNEDQVAVYMPPGSIASHLCVRFISETPVLRLSEKAMSLPSPVEQRIQCAKLIAAMLSTSELNDMHDSAPIILLGQQTTGRSNYPPITDRLPMAPGEKECMKLKVTQFDYGVGGGGTAHAMLYAPPAPATGLGQLQAMEITMGFHLHRTRSENFNPNHALIPMPPGSIAPFVCIEFQTIKQIPKSGTIFTRELDDNLPHPSEYRGNLSKMIANRRCPNNTSHLSAHNSGNCSISLQK
jgi:hypothetical protein